MGMRISVCMEAAMALTAGAKTMLMAISSANSGLTLVEFGVSFDGVTASAVPALVDIVHSTQATAGTETGTPTITQIGGRATGGELPTAGGNYTAEPTVLTRLKAFYVPQFMGSLVIQNPLGREEEIDDSGGSLKAIGIRANVSAAVNGIAYMILEKNG